jgi:DnaJ-class molecular chaperone
MTDRVEVVCRECRGNGFDRGMPWSDIPCEDCGGSGQVYKFLDEWGRELVTCPHCKLTVLATTVSNCDVRRRERVSA